LEFVTRVWHILTAVTLLSALCEKLCVDPFQKNIDGLTVSVIFRKHQIVLAVTGNGYVESRGDAPVAQLRCDQSGCSQ